MKIFKKLLAVTVILTVLFSVTASASVMDFTVGSTTTNAYNGEVFTTGTLDAAPFVNESDRTMVPVRAISETFGAQVDWDDAKQEVTVTSGETVLKLVIGSNVATVNGNEITMDSAPTLVNARTFVPLRFIGEALGYNINYCNASEQIIIDDTAIIAKCGNHILTFAEFEALYGIIYNLNHDALANQGASEEDIKARLAQFALEEAMTHLLVLNAFPEVGITDEIKEGVLKASEAQAKEFSTPMLSLVNLIEEKTLFATLAPAVMHYSKQPDVVESAKAYVQAKHILVTDEKTAQEVYEKATSGADFDELVAQYNTDPGMQQNPNGYIFTYGQMVEPFEKAAFGLGFGEISKPVKSDFGYHIIKRSADDSEITQQLALMSLSGILTSAEEATPLISFEELCGMLK